MSTTKMPEYTMLTPLPLTPDVMPHDLEQLMGMGIALPCDLVPHYPYMVPPMGPAVLLEGIPSGLPFSDPDTPPVTNPEEDERIDEDEDEDDDREDEERIGGVTSRGKRLGKDPFAPQCKIPLPTPFSPFEYWLEPSFIRRRNERERQRVRNVNDGFERLKGHLPISSKDKDKRLSKVEILRMAIRYIRNLQDVLENHGGMEDSKENYNMLHSESD